MYTKTKTNWKIPEFTASLPCAKCISMLSSIFLKEKDQNVDSISAENSQEKYSETYEEPEALIE